MKIAFRVDSSLQIGSGHVMRCLTLAMEMKSQGCEVLFICRDLPGNILKQIKENDFPVSVLQAPPKESNSKLKDAGYISWLQVSVDQDAEETGHVLAHGIIWDWLVVDHYALDSSWEKKQKNYVKKIAVIDDLANRTHECDLLLDQNFYENNDSRYISLVSDKCLMLLGPRYALLRKEFFEARRGIKVRTGYINRILVFFGGVDLQNATTKTLYALDRLNLKDVNIDVVIGSSNPNRSQIESLCLGKNNIHLHVQVNDMARLMAVADLCIGGGGTATWERCCLGLPAFAWPIAENQKQLLLDCAKNGLVYTPNVIDPSVDDIVIHLRALFQNALLCHHISFTGYNTIDANGARRVSRILSLPLIGLRLAKMDDMQDLFEWRNHPIIRKYSRNASPIAWQKHKRWFEQVLNDPDCIILIGAVDNQSVGVLRFDLSLSEAEISLYLVPGQQGRGYGAALVESGESWLRENYPDIKSVMAEVLSENTASHKLFEFCGYRMSAMKYRKDIC